jgi:uncharacterized protein (TIGR03086 family)
MMERFDLRPAADAVAATADGVSEAQFGNPTPSGEWTVGVMINHLIGLTDAFTDGARKIARTDTPELDPRVPADWRDLLQVRLDRLVEAWRDPAAWAGETTVGGVTLPAPLTAAVVVDELVVHGWDLARGTSQPYEPDPAMVAASISFAEQFADLPGGPFGPSRPTEGSEFERLLGLTGRDPAWKP